MNPPKSTVGTVAASLGILAVGAGVGAVAVGLAVKNKGDPMGGAVLTIEGAVFGVLAAGFGGLVLAAAAPKWKAVGDTAALVGVGAPVVLGAIGLTKATIAQAESGALPAAAQTYSITSANSGQSLSLNVGDTVNVSLDSTYAAPTVDQTGILSAGVSSADPSTSGNTIYPFTAITAGSANITSSSSGSTTSTGTTGGAVQGGTQGGQTGTTGSFTLAVTVNQPAS